ncbi:MAG: Y-family DNA polymerase [Pseudomonadota bacterium]|uniref:Y-family DNA polymerase n=1 Tax=Thalassospira sp. MCCC 1A02898 TaxID=501868 RepID=UPI002E84B02B|nr:Y-family DNA polymerase [Pseudomonadota bacterium]
MNNDGCTIARSPEAKALGIKMGQPLFQIRDLVRRHNVIVKSSNYALYGDISRRVMTLIANEVPDSAIYSIDEIFIDLDNTPIDHDLWARDLKAKILRETGIPVGIGISTTKTLAKLANRLAKKSPKAKGVVVLDDQKWIDLALERTEAGDIWGVGRKFALKLASIGVTTARQLRDMPDTTARKMMTVGGLKTVRELRGIRCINLDDSPPQRETVCVSRSFGKEIDDREMLKEALITFAGRACSKLRRLNLVACRCQLFILSNRFKMDRQQFSRGCELTMTPATNDTRIASNLVGQNINRIWRNDLAVKKAGILMLDLCRPEDAPRDLFTGHCQLDNPLMKAIDQLEGRFGKDAVTVGRVSRSKVPDWFMTSTNRSPCYTTRWQDIPIVW